MGPKREFGSAPAFRGRGGARSLHTGGRPAFRGRGDTKGTEEQPPQQFRREGAGEGHEDFAEPSFQSRKPRDPLAISRENEALDEAFGFAKLKEGGARLGWLLNIRAVRVYISSIFL